MMICVTNRKLCRGDFLERIRQLAAGGADVILLREKDLSPAAYTELAEKCLAICREYSTALWLNSFTGTAAALQLPVQLPLSVLQELTDADKEKLPAFGASVHSLADAQLAEKLCADWLIAGHIFPTSCKPDLPPRGLDFLREAYGIQDKDVVKCSNYIGQSMDMAADCKFQGLVLAGHIGKLIKVSGGVMNTHSRWADCRMDLLATAMLRAGFSADRARAVLDCVTTDDALALLSEEEREATIGQIMRSIEKYMEYRMADQMPVGAILYSNVYGILGKTSKVDTLMHLWEEENQ